MSMEDSIIADIRADLMSSVDERTKNNFQRFFKEEFKFYGVKTPDVEKIAKRHFEKVKGRSKGEVFSICENLLQSGFHEEAMVAFMWAYSLRKQYEANDFSVFERWVERYVDNWAKCDTLCNHSVGALVECFPRCISGLKAWTKSDNRWLRRASAVSLIIPAKKGMFLDDVFRISSSLLKDRDDLVQKGYGWLLKEAGELHQNEVFEYVMKNKGDMPRTALRYAIEKFPKDLRDEAMKK
jgi:3-methyladenine DNA glycosylase AlkD